MGNAQGSSLMQKNHKIAFAFCILFFSSIFCLHAQKLDTLKRKDSIPAAKVDSLIQIQHSPKKAAIRSAIVPGLGQAYNKKYWKIPIIYAALGVTGYLFVYNLQTYKDLRFAYEAKYKASVPPYDSSDYHNIKEEYKPLSLEALQQYRNEYRQYVDYSAVFFVLFWGLNVVDAVVDAHLKAFDISPDLSLKVKPSYNPFTSRGGITLVFKFRHRPQNLLVSRY